jgi:hypothetical protein
MRRYFGIRTYCGMRRYFVAVGTVAAGSAAVLLALGVPAAQAGTGGEQPPSGVVSGTAVAGTPELNPANDNPGQQIKQLVECGGVMYAVGSFTQILQGGNSYTRSNIFSFSATAPYTVTSFAPVVTGTSDSSSDVIDSIAFVGGNCSDAYIGGHISAVNGTSVKNIAEISTSTGNVITGFGHSANGEVETLLGYSNHLLVGGYFTSINNSTADSYMASLNPTTGKNDGFIALNISGNYSYAPNNGTRVYNQSLSHGGTLDLVMGDFTTAGGLPRQQIFMLNLATTPATVTGWTSPEWDGSMGELSSSNPTGYPYQCATVEPFYIQAAAWSPDDSTIYIGTTGYHPNGFPVGQSPRTGLCDAAASFPATVSPPPQPNGQPGYVLHNWVNYTGCDSLYSAAADSLGAYFGGHERFSMNPDDCDALGSNAYNAPGIEGLDPANGNLYLNSASTAGYYKRSRGYGADDMLLTSAGLWIASDNFSAAQECGGRDSLSGICLLPYKK